MKKCFIFLSITCTLIMFACTCKKPDEKITGETRPTQIRKSLFHNPDSLLKYAQKAYLEDDAYGLYVTGAAAFLREQDSNFPDSCTTVPLDEARIMLKRAAELNQPDAINLIHCLQSEDVWGE